MAVLKKRLSLKPAVDLTQFLDGMAVRHAALGTADDLWVLASLESDIRARVLRHKGGTPLTLTLDEPRGAPRFVAALAKDETLTLSSDGQASVWDGHARLTAQFSIAGGVTAVQAQHGGLFITRHDDGAVRQWSNTGTPLAQYAGPHDAFTVLPAEGILLVGNGVATRMEAGRTVGSFKLPARPEAVALGNGHVVTSEMVDGCRVLTVWALGKQRAQPVVALVPEDATGRVLLGPIHARGSHLLLVEGPCVYRFAVVDLVDA